MPSKKKSQQPKRNKYGYDVSAFVKTKPIKKKEVDIHLDTSFYCKRGRALILVHPEDIVLLKKFLNRVAEQDKLKDYSK